MARPDTISSVVPFLVATAATMEGVDVGKALAGVKANLAGPPRPDEHAPLSTYLDVWRRVMAAVGDEAFPLRASNAFKLEDHELFGFLAISCGTLGEAYERTAKYRELYATGARWELQTDDAATRVIWYPWTGDLADGGFRAAMEYAVVDMDNAIRRLGRGEPRPMAVVLRHAAPATTAPFTAQYGVTPTWDGPLYELRYPPRTHELPVASFNSRLRDYFDEECRRQLDALGGGARVVDQVRKALIRAMDGGDATMEGVAKKLGLSARSLQRRLADEDARFADVLSDVRAEFAKRYLTRGTLSASEVAYLVGFTEPPAFFKAFKRWTGMTPGEFLSSRAG
ncbi:MAG TPA: AraC family transcriptional regulator ligand-binding domain-containing protein [Polyangia bacterium]|nr:AraC family transcriptional regulator ligand-binding domain-containing protein [Polyangia bacterium]